MRCRKAIALFLVLSVTSCGGDDEPAAAAPQNLPDAQAQGAFDAQLDALERAEDVDELNRRKKAAIDDALRHADGDPR